MRIPSGVTDQVIFFVAVDATDLKTRETALSSFTVYRARDTGAATIFTTPTVAELSAANMPGVYSLLLDEDMTIAAGNDSEEMVFHITQAAMAPVTRSIELYRPKITAGETITAANGAADADIERLQGSLIATPTVAGVLEVDVTHWIGTAAATPTVAGVPEVDMTHVAGATTNVSTLATTVESLNTKIGTPSNLGGGATVSFNLSDIEGQTDDIGVAGAGLTNIGTIATVTTLTNLPAITANWLTATGINADAFTAVKFADDVSTEFANKVWDTDATGRQTQGTFGQAIGDPVADTNTIYKAVVTDATGATVGVDVVALKAETVSIQSDTDNIQTRLPAALVGGRMDSDVAVMQAATITAAVIATNAIDADAIAADAVTEIQAGLATPTNITAGTITTVTTLTNLPAITANWLTAAGLAQDAAQEIADEVLNRNLAGGGSGNTRNVRNTLRAIRNKVSEAGGTLTVTEEDDLTPAWTAAVTRTAATNPITAVDPA